MTSIWSDRYAQRSAEMTASEIRELLKLIDQPDIISFAGGIPAAEFFPHDRIEAAYQHIFADSRTLAQAFQYSMSEGYLPLREVICDMMARQGVFVQPDNVLITAGSQQALDFLGKLFVNPGDRLVVEKPSYLGALQAFRMYQPEFLAIPVDDHGICLDSLEAAMRTGPKLLYTVPNFQNPSGVTLSLERRRALLQMCSRYGVCIVEDHAYEQLRYEGDAIPPLFALDTPTPQASQEHGNTIYLGTFSKTLAPALRVGWIVAPKDVVRRLVLIKQASDLHVSTINQMVVYEIIKTGIDEHIRKLRRVYAERRNTMLAAMDRYFPSTTRWTQPIGGLFIWVELGHGLYARRLLEQAIAEERVAFVPGDAFFADTSRTDTCRFSFSATSPQRIEEGIYRLGKLLQKLLHT